MLYFSVSIILWVSWMGLGRSLGPVFGFRSFYSDKLVLSELIVLFV